MVFMETEELERGKESMESMVLFDQINFLLFIKNPSGHKEIVQ